MEISNKTFGILCVGVVIVTVYVRAQSLHKDAQPITAAPPAPEKVVTRTVHRSRGIPDSALPPLPTDTSGDDQALAAEAPVVVGDLPTTPAQTPPPAATTPPATPPNSTEATNGEEDDLTDTDDLGPMADDAPTNNAVQLSDRDMLRIMLGSMPPEQRESFRLMWYGMTPDDRQDFLDQLRQGQQGG